VAAPRRILAHYSQSPHVNAAVLLARLLPFLPVACSLLPYINRSRARQGRVQSSDIGQIRQRREILGLLHFKHKKRRAVGFLIAALRDDSARWWCEDGGCCGSGGEDGCAMGSWLQLAALLGDLSG
jgi:hypothetical protein